MIYVCRCCDTELQSNEPHVEVVVSMERPRRGMHTSGRMAAATCNECAITVADNIFRVASLWTPTAPCVHNPKGLF